MGGWQERQFGGGSNTGGSPRKSSDERREEMDNVRRQVADEIAKKYVHDNNPVTKFLLKSGILEDMEVLHKLIMDASDNSSIFLYKNKLDAIKSYISTVKDTVIIQEKQAKVDAQTSAAADEDFGGVTVSLKRTKDE